MPAKNTLFRTPHYVPRLALGILFYRCFRSDRYAANTRSLDRLVDEPRSFYVLDEFAKVLRRDVAALRSAQRLLDRHESAVEHARSGKLLGVGNEVLPDAGDDVDFACKDQLEARVIGRPAHQLGVLQTSAQEQIVSALRRYADPHSFAVNVGDFADR